MAKKPFGWIADAEEQVVPSPDRPSRQEKTADATTAMRLAEALLALPPSEWPHLPMHPSIVEELAAFKRIKPRARGAQKRHVQQIGSLLRDEDLPAIEEAINAGGTGRTARQETIDHLVRWRTRLLDEGPEALDAFLVEYPKGDRQRIRQLAARSAQLEGNAATKRNRTLLEVLKQAAGLS